MDSCLLCLEINGDILEYIRVNSTEWKELDIARTIEKHFWSLNTIQLSSWICLSCWREVNAFHEFFLRIEEAHANFGKIKVEAECKEELSTQKSNIKDISRESEKDDEAFSFIEPEILIHQTGPSHLAESVIFIDQTKSDKSEDSIETAIIEPLEEQHLDDIPPKRACRRLRLRNDLSSKDPLEKSKKKQTRSKIAAEKKVTENSVKDIKIKEEPVDLGDNNSESKSDIDNDGSYHSDNNYLQTEKCKTPKNFKKISTRCNEYDDFIAEHFKKQLCCDLCQKTFEDFPALIKHFTKTHQQRGYVVCCKNKFFQRACLADHIQRHINPEHFKCIQCGKILSDRRNLESHMVRVHRPADIDAKYSCDICGNPFPMACLLRAHKLTHLPKEEKKFPCTECGKFYASPHLLKIHTEVIHLKKHAKVCYICGKTLVTSTEYKAHMNKHEGIPAPVINCDVCGLRLISERSLKLHKESQHPVGGKQDHPCHLCDKVSPTARALKKHINTMHEKGLDHKCTMCGKVFRRAEGLKEHMASHTGTPLYMCPWCPQTFNSNGNMHSHRKNKHPKEYLELKMQRYM